MNNKRKMDTSNKALIMSVKKDGGTPTEQNVASQEHPAFLLKPLVSTKYGKLNGIRNTDVGVIQWLGVPYAKAPVGELRWRAPRELEAWDSIVETTQYGNSCVQLANGSMVGNEDCLYMNIWRPDSTSSKLPVLVFAHGGGNLTGSGQDFKGDQLSKETNSIVISVNYRLGAMGFFRHPTLRTGDAIDDSGNYGLLDILYSLQWVQGNIDQFGGDPENVTLSGQSAGARNVLAALISPLAEGLFHKAIILSGGMTTAGSAAGDAKSEDVLRRLLVRTGKVGTEEEARMWAASHNPETIAAFLRNQDAKLYAQAYDQVAIQMEPFPHLFEDGTVIPEGGFQSIKDGSYHKFPTILGSTSNEFSGFALSDPEFIPSVMDGSLLTDQDKMKLYTAAAKYGSDLYAGFNVEEVAKALTIHPDQPPVYAYRLSWGTRDGVIDPGLRALLGAPHGADMMFYTGDYTTAMQNYPSGYITDENEPGRKALSSTLREYVRLFLYTGNPNGEGSVAWKEWTAESDVKRTLKLDADAKQASNEMSPEYLGKEDTLAKMESDPSLTAEQRDWIKEKLFIGRFFWNSNKGGRL
ncbi:carboxylesterase/lipase family protein [Paenibacillus sp. LPE1-1-1.1]|uniref:carboxylesterase/lipase family protein n=1 Tax=Paenibacillus sp. LPE1-1-1.1 TaxID=3135230 RepID=UPI003431BACD